MFSAALCHQKLLPCPMRSIITETDNSMYLVFKESSQKDDKLMSCLTKQSSVFIKEVRIHNIKRTYLKKGLRTRTCTENLNYRWKKSQQSPNAASAISQCDFQVKAPYMQRTEQSSSKCTLYQAQPITVLFPATEVLCEVSQGTVWKRKRYIK